MTDPIQLLLRFGQGGFTPTAEGDRVLFEVAATDLARVIRTLKHTHGLPLKTVAATDERAEGRGFRIYYVFGIPKEACFLVPFLSVSPERSTFPSLTPEDQEFAMYEREILTFFGLMPQGHPQAERINLHAENFPKDIYPLRKDFHWDQGIVEPKEKEWATFERYAGEGVYEIPVGPVHAGIIEPGHFRFSVLGEEILRLEPRLGYVHKGTEKLFEALPSEKRVALAERISGDSSFHHALAYCQAVESLAAVTVPKRALYLRMVLAELERLANHYNDLAFIMLDTGLSFGGSQGTRLRERVMAWNERLTSSRFLRGRLMPGGLTADILDGELTLLKTDLIDLENDFLSVMEAVAESLSLLNRLQDTGRLERTVGEDHGIVGIGARAVGIERDARVDFPYAAYDTVYFSIPTETTGDVFARYKVREREVHQSFKILHQAIDRAVSNPGPVAIGIGSLMPNAHAIGIVEGWRGDIVYFIMTDANGMITRVKVRDPSFLNWQVFPYLVTNDIVPDFPLINKSLNLSYSGNDL
ncbi:MAG: NADH-quinone oxidoreductase subunit C [Candidatus Moraniibacteriota bacterium]|nr:MAG: NADH-quinone oxidoreductase subunit C [Candidatus Moranbacteria bacterium]